MLSSQVPGVFLQFAKPLSFIPGTHYTHYPGEDLAALFVSNESISFMADAGFEIGNAWGVPVGALTVGWGFAQNWPYVRPMALKGMVSGKPSLQELDGNRSNRISVNFDNHYGCSGGPLTLRSNPAAVIGVISTKARDPAIQNSRVARVLADLRKEQEETGLIASTKIQGVDVIAALEDILELQNNFTHFGMGSAVALTKDIVKRLLETEPLHLLP